MRGATKGRGVRVIGGLLRGRRLSSPTGEETRPTSDRVREALFNILSPAIEGALFLDGYAGTGAIGIEALSRGARRCVFVESGRRPLRYLRANLESLGLDAAAAVIARPFATSAAIVAREGPFDIAFFDPPYGPGEILRAIRLAAAGAFLAEGGLLVAQHETRMRLPEAEGRLTRERVARYGNTTLSFYRPAAGGPDAD